MPSATCVVSQGLAIAGVAASHVVGADAQGVRRGGEPASVLLSVTATAPRAKLGAPENATFGGSATGGVVSTGAVMTTLTVLL